ncbi:hypothetical protein EZS27_029707 [termite gut metagenome]|jgi:hypothetical protein|uniref:Uncharacterized protein n=1 Tax=termite gut metagenome TaxID=433724 RepID=A0A5J4QGB6_9ZZZZ
MKKHKDNNCASSHGTASQYKGDNVTSRRKRRGIKPKETKY